MYIYIYTYILYIYVSNIYTKYMYIYIYIYISDIYYIWQILHVLPKSKINSKLNITKTGLAGHTKNKEKRNRIKFILPRLLIDNCV